MHLSVPEMPYINMGGGGGGGKEEGANEGKEKKELVVRVH